MGLFGGFSIFSVVSLMLTAVGFIVQLIGYSAPYWIKMRNENAGLWKTCAGGLCEYFVGSIHVDKPAMLEATQVLETLAFLVILATLIFMGLKFTVMQEQKILPVVIFILQFTSVGLILLGVVIYGTESHTTSFGYAFVFVIIASIFILVAGVFSFLDWRGASLTA